MVALLVFGGPVNTAIFRPHVPQGLGPTLGHADIVEMDARDGHKSEAGCNAIREAKAHTLFLPPYCPDLTAIEQVVSILTH